MRKSPAISRVAGVAAGVRLAALLAGAAVAAPAAAAPVIRGEVVASPGLDRTAVVVELHALPTPYEAVRVQVPGEAERPPLAVVRAGADGAFLLEAPAPGMVRVVARAPGRTAMRLELQPLVDDLTLPPVELPAAAAVPVRVRDAEGRPVAGARVAVRFGRGELWRPERRRGWRPLRQAATTDDAGRALASHAAGEEELTIDAFAPGRPGAARTAAPRGELDLVLPAGVEREVEVRRRGGPVARAALWVAADGGQRALADARGRARLSLPEGEPVELRVEGPDGWRGHYRVRVERPGEEEEEEAPPPLRFELRPPVVLPLRIVAADGGEPVAGAFAWMSGAEGAAVTAGPDGMAHLPLPAGEDVAIHAAAGGHQRLSLELPAAEHPAAGEPLVLPLVAHGFVAGEVVDPAGQPIAGARVLLRHRWATEGEWEAGTRGVESAESDGAGRFRVVTAFPHGEVLLRAEAAGRARLETTAAVGASGLRLVLGEGGAVGGRLRTADGGAVEEGQVRLVPATEPGTRPMDANGESLLGLTAVPDAAGSFHFPRVAAGMHELVARVPGHEPLTTPVVVTEGGEVDLGRLDLRPEAVLEGQALDAEGQPIAGAKVHVEQHRVGLRGVGDRRGGDETDEEGRFRIGGLGGALPVSLRVEAEGFVSMWRHDLRLPLAEPLEIRLSRGGTVFGVVVDAAGEPVAGARLHLRNDPTATRHRRATPWHTAFGESGDDGRFEIGGVPAGPLQVSVRHARLAAWNELPIGEVGEGGRLGPLRIELGAAAELTGRVRRADGGPAAGAEVRVGEPSRGTRHLNADALGRFRVPGLRPGAHRIEAFLGFEGEAEAEVVLGDGPVEVELVLEPTTGIGGRVVDAEGRPAGRGRLRLEHDGGERVEHRDQLGRFAIVGLDEGTYRLTAEVDGVGRGTHPQPIVVRRGAPVEGLVIALAPGARLAGRVTGVAAEDLPYLQVTVTAEGGGTASTAPARPDGSFEVRGLPGGRYTVTALLAHTFRAQSIAVEVAPGESAEGLEIDLSGLTLTLAVTVLGRPHDESVWVAGPDRARSPGARRLGPGRFVFEGLAPGRHQVLVRASPAGPHHVREVEVTGSQDLAIDLEGWPVTGWVLDEAGAPVPGIAVEVVAPQMPVRRSAYPLQGVACDEAGAFELPALPPGSWRLVAGDGSFWGEARVEVPPGGAAGVVVTVRRPDESADPGR